MKEEKKLYRVKSIDQESGREFVGYYLADNLAQLESEIADILNIEPLTPFEDLTSPLEAEIEKE